MGLAEMQKALARLYTDAHLRERFLTDPEAVGHELGFVGEEAKRLAEVSPARLNSFAMSLQNKRLGQVTKLLPLSSRVLGPRFADAFRRYAKTQLPGGTKKHLGDALAFAIHLEKILRTEGEQPRWVLDLLRYEKSRIKAADPGRHFVVSLFRHDISRLVRSLARKEDAAILAHACVAVWARRKRGGIIRYALFMLPRLPRRK